MKISMMAIVKKEFVDFLSSPKFWIVFLIFGLVMVASAYQGVLKYNLEMDQYQRDLQQREALVTELGEKNLPPFFSMGVPKPTLLSPFLMMIENIGIIGALLGVILGYDAISCEKKKGSLKTLLSYPIFRDTVINGKFLGRSLILVLAMIITASISIGVMIYHGLTPTLGEMIRIMLFIFSGLVYMILFLTISIFFSVIFNDESSALFSSVIVLLLSATLFIMLLALIINIAIPQSEEQFNWEGEKIDSIAQQREKLYFTISKISPTMNFKQFSGLMLSPYKPLSVATSTTGPPEPATLYQSLSYAWTQIAILLGLTIVTFVLSYISFMRQDIR